MNKTRGVVYVHSAPVPLCPHIEWAIGSVIGPQHRFEWRNQPVQPETVRTEMFWSGSAGTGATLTSKLLSMKRLRFEVTEEPTSTTEGRRWAATPGLGMFSAVIGPHGDIQVPEEQLKQAVVSDALGTRTLQESLNALLGTDWDLELDIFRTASENASIRWLHRVG